MPCVPTGRHEVGQASAGITIKSPHPTLRKMYRRKHFDRGKAALALRLAAYKLCCGCFCALHNSTPCKRLLSFQSKSTPRSYTPHHFVPGSMRSASLTACQLAARPVVGARCIRLQRHVGCFPGRQSARGARATAGQRHERGAAAGTARNAGKAATRHRAGLMPQGKHIA